MSDDYSDTGSVVAERTDSHEDETAQEGDARVYRVLGEQFLARPERERVDAVGSWASQWRHSAETLPPEFDAALKRIEDGAGADTETLRTAYTHLFRGVSEQAPDPPYESMYVDGSFYSGTTTEIRNGYRWAGFDVDDADSNEPPDHLGLKLQFLGELVAMDDGNQEPDEPDLEEALWWFLNEHLTEWLPACHARLQRQEPHEYYAGLLDLTLAVVTAHHKRLAANR